MFGIGDILKHKNTTKPLIVKIVKMGTMDCQLELVCDYESNWVKGKTYSTSLNALHHFELYKVQDNIEKIKSVTNKTINVTHNCTCGAYKLGYKTNSKMHYSWCLMYKE